jgi:hypothetical protein
MKFRYRPVVEKTRITREFPYAPTESLREAATQALHILEEADKAYGTTGAQQVVYIEVMPIREERDAARRRTELGEQLTLFAEELHRHGEEDSESV